jgi:Glycosyltransferase family 87
VKRFVACVVVAAALFGGTAVVAGAQSTTRGMPARLVLPDRPDVPPPGYTRTARAITRIAAARPEVRSARAEHRPAYSRAYVSGRGRWQVSFYVPPERGTRSDEIAQVIVDDRGGRVIEAWTGPQVEWTMARGIPGQFGRAVNAPWVWIGLCILFVAPFLRPPLRMLHADLAVLLAFSISYAFFGAGNLDVSVPSAYPLLAYLLGRMLWLAFRPARARPIALTLSPNALLLGLVFLVGFRVVLNVTNGNVIDVGYSGVVGADRLLHGESLYGGFPPDNPRGDTYGPLAYVAYIPFVLVAPWGGTWDDLPAAHAAAVVFDLACLAGMWAAGNRFGGRPLAVLLAYLWAACPFTLLVENSGANDALVAALVLAAFLCLRRPAARGALAVLAGLTKFAPLALVPLFATYGRHRARSLAVALGTGALVLLPVAVGPGLERFWDRTLGFQSERSSPFSIWGLYGGLDGLQVAVTLVAAALALAVAWFPRERDELTVATLGAAVLIALQLTVTHWFYLYIVWFLPLLLLALLARPGVRAPGAAPARSTAPAVAVRT